MGRPPPAKFPQPLTLRWQPLYQVHRDPFNGPIGFAQRADLWAAPSARLHDLGSGCQRVDLRRTAERSAQCAARILCECRTHIKDVLDQHYPLGNNLRAHSESFAAHADLSEIRLFLRVQERAINDAPP